MTAAVEGKTILLVGGAGLIGHTLALRLKAAGADVHVLDGLEVNNVKSFVAGTTQTLQLYHRITLERLQLMRDAGVTFHVEDARDYHRVSHIVADLKPQILVQLAAVSQSTRSNKDPYSTFDHSFRTLENTLDAARGLVDRYVYLSSSMVYGNFKAEAVTEDEHCEPLGIYAALKFAGEKLVIAYNQVFSLPYVIVRPSAVYGERDVGARVVQKFIEGAMREQRITIFGDGSDRMDFTHVDDVCTGLVCAISSPNALNQIYNLTYGQGRSLNELAELLKLHFPALRVSHELRDSLMPERGTLKIDKARTQIGYSPKYSLAAGLDRYVAWYRQLGNF
jgi:nucleoside-diphosphate-sugar epimerase